jgi:hypothetical protein
MKAKEVKPLSKSVIQQGGLEKEEMRKCLELLEKLEHEEDAIEFLQPVDYKGNFCF